MAESSAACSFATAFATSPRPQQFSSVMVFLFFALALVVPSGYSLGAVVLALAGLIFTVGAVLRPRSAAFIRPTLNRTDRALLWVMALFFLSWVAEVVLDGQSLSRLDKPLRIVYAAFALLWLLRHPPRPAFFWGGLATGAIAAGLLALWQFAVLGRADGHTNAIQFGNIALLLGMLCLAGLGWVWQTQRPGNRRRAWAAAWMAALVLGFAGGLLASVLSGTRGGWIGIPLVLALVLWGYRHGLPKKALGALALVAAVVLCALVWMPGSPVKARIAQAQGDIQQYQSGRKDTSLGLRLQMWQAGGQALQDAPWLGHGQQGLHAYMAALAAQGTITPTAAAFGHLHNDYLDIAARRGLPGLALLLALYGVPLWLFWRRLRDRHTGPGALAGVLLCVSYASYSLTQGFLAHNNGVMLFFFTLVICQAMVRQADSGQADSRQTNQAAPALCENG